VCPCLSALSCIAPQANKIRTIGTCPLAAAKCNGVDPACPTIASGAGRRVIRVNRFEEDAVEFVLDPEPPPRCKVCLARSANDVEDEAAMIDDSPALASLSFCICF
jgi:hypothetical protein